MQVTITLPDTLVVSKGDRAKTWNYEHEVPLSEFDPEMIAEGCIYGFTQKYADSASQASNESQAQAFMEKTEDAILKKNWTRRGTGGVSLEQAVGRSIVRSLIRAELSTEDYKAFNALSTGDQNEKLDANLEANKEALAESIAAEIARRKAKAKAKKSLADKVKIAL